MLNQNNSRTLRGRVDPRTAAPGFIHQNVVLQEETKVINVSEKNLISVFKDGVSMFRCQEGPLSQ